MSGDRMETCPRCGRTTRIRYGRYTLHATVADTRYRCRMSGQLTPATGDTPADHEHRAKLVADLADQVQHDDPYVVWDYLTALPASELQRLLQVSLAAIPVDGHTLPEIFAWVTELPTARYQEIPA